MGNIREHGSDPPTEQRVRPPGIVDRVGEQGISRLADLRHQGRTQTAVVGMNRYTAEALGQNAPIFRHRMEQYASADPWSARLRRREGARRKARNQRRRELGRPHPAEQFGGHGCGFGFAAANGFHFHVCSDTKLAKERYSFRQRRHPLSPEGRTEPASRVVASNVRQRQQGCLSPTIRRTLELLVMEKNQVAVSGEANVELDPATIELLCLTKSGKRVFGRARSGAAMADHRWRQDAGCSARTGELAQIRSASRGKCRAVPPGTVYPQGAAALGGSWRLAPRSSPVC